MTAAKAHYDEFSIIGIEARTTNAKEMSGTGVIAAQWQKFFQEAIQAKIPGKVDGTIYALYTDYASNRNGEYSFVIGMKVKPDANAEPGMVRKHIPAGEYAVLTSGKGPVAQVVPAAWLEIWSLEEKNQLGGLRAYRDDFEVYDQRAADPLSSQVDIYVGLK